MLCANNIPSTTHLEMERYINHPKNNVILTIEKPMKTKKHLLVTLLLLAVSACAAKGTKGFKNEGYSSHPGGQGHPWDKGRSF